MPTRTLTQKVFSYCDLLRTQSFFYGRVGFGSSWLLYNYKGDHFSSLVLICPSTSAGLGGPVSGALFLAPGPTAWWRDTKDCVESGDPFSSKSKG